MTLALMADSLTVQTPRRGEAYFKVRLSHYRLSALCHRVSAGQRARVLMGAVTRKMVSQSEVGTSQSEAGLTNQKWGPANQRRGSAIIDVFTYRNQEEKPFTYILNGVK